MYKMIIVDDEYFTCEGLKILLDWESYNISIVGTAQNGEEGLKLAKTVSPDIIITDIRMKSMDGLDMIKHLRKDGFAGEVIIISGFKVFEYAQDAINNGVRSYLLKPLTRGKMINAVESVLEALDEKKAEDRSETISLDTWSRIKHYVDENFMRGITLNSVAETMHLNGSYASRIFKKKTGKNFTDYVTMKRMEYACNLLANTEMSVNEIIDYLSYKDPRHFRELFKKHTGYSPSEYRNAMRRKE